MLGQVGAAGRAEGSAQCDALRVDTANCAPTVMLTYSSMNPFHFDPKWRIPVPGTTRCSSSVESLWQGLKLVDGELALDLFDRPAVKRPPESARGPGYDYGASTFRYGERDVDLVTARLTIYLPAYLHLLEHLVPDPVVAGIDAARRAGRRIVFYDWDENFDVLDPSASFSHSAILAAWFGGQLDGMLAQIRRVAGDELAGRLPLGRYQALHTTVGG